MSNSELWDAGLDRSAVWRRVQAGVLHPVYPGTYSLGHDGLTFEARCMAAVLSVGHDAVLSHWPAAYLHRLWRWRPPQPEVTVRSTDGSFAREFPVHRARRLDRRDRTWLDRIPITSVPRTLLDLAPVLELADLTRACHEAHIRHRTTPAEIEACIGRNPGRRGTRRLRAAATGEGLTLSALEDGFLDLLRAAKLRLPKTNVRAGEDRVDCRWQPHGPVVELLSWRYHGSRAAFEADVSRRRRSVHTAFTWGDVFERPAQTVAEVRALLAAHEP